MQSIRGKASCLVALGLAAAALAAASSAAPPPDDDATAPVDVTPSAPLPAPDVVPAANAVPPAPAPPAPPLRPLRPYVVPQPERLPTIAGPSSRSRKDTAYSAIASALAHGPRAVFCWSERDWAVLAPDRGDVLRLGYVDLRAPRQVNLSPLVCRQLDMLRYRGLRPPPTDALALAVDVLAHETMHTVGVEDEAVAECYGMQLTARTSRELGTSEAYGRALGRLLWAAYDGPSLPSRYRSRQCRDGGRLDLDRTSAAWPSP